MKLCVLHLLVDIGFLEIVQLNKLKIIDDTVTICVRHLDQLVSFLLTIIKAISDYIMIEIRN